MQLQNWNNPNLDMDRVLRFFKNYPLNVFSPKNLKHKKVAPGILASNKKSTVELKQR